MATMSARYTVIDGEVIAQERGGVRHQLVPDGLGSVVALYDDAGVKTDTFSYWPYGESAGRTGTTVTPFQFVGNYGCYENNKILYVRNRFYLKEKSSWFSEDEIINVNLSRYNYCLSSPVSYIDTDGFQPVKPPDLNEIRPFPPYKEPRVPVSAYHKCMGKAPCANRWARVANDHGKELPGWHNGIGDALKHCLLGCLVFRHCGSCAFDVFVISKEQNSAHWMDCAGEQISGGHYFEVPGYAHRDSLHHWDPVEGPMDLHNDNYGKKCAQSNNNCLPCCLSGLRRKYLYWLPRGYPGHPWSNPFLIGVD